MLNSQIIRHDFRSLAPGRFLNDDALLFFLLLLITKHRNKNIVFLFNSFFFKKLTKSWDGDRASVKKPKFDYQSVKRWTKYVDITKKKFVFIPIHLPSERHWVLVVINFYDRHMLFYDSLSGSHKAIITIIKKYVCLELLSKQVYKEVPTNYWKSWTFNMKASSTQANGCDCGIFVAMNIWCLMNNLPTDTSAVQKNMDMFRKYMALCLLKKTMVGATS